MKTTAYRGMIAEEIPNSFNALLESVREAVFVIQPNTGQLLEANQPAASMLGYARAELLALQADRIFALGTALFHPLTSGSLTSALSGVQCVTKQGQRVSCVLRTHAVEHGGRAAMLVTAYEAEAIPALAPSHQVSEIPAGVGERTEEYEEVIETTLDFPSIVGQGEQIRGVCRLIGLVAQTNTTVLIQGESGTGKELVAQAIHFHSCRSGRPLIKVNCAALTETLLESELFGHKKGAFTGAIQDRKGRFKLADGGTIILDEIDSLSLSGQAKLLRVLQEKEFEPVGDSTTLRVDVRVIAITNTDLVKKISAGHFREDLYYRLNAFPIHLPPLRKRIVDIPLLARHFLKDCAGSLKKQITDIDPDAMSLLMDYSWPGNVRELANTIEYAVILEKGAVLQAASCPDKLQPKTHRHPSLKERLELVEKQIILEALETSNGVKTRTAARLGIDRRNLGYFLQKHDIHIPSLSA
jgi:transcriptional regulator with GAF, ATPase, and Fis domain